MRSLTNIGEGQITPAYRKALQAIVYEGGRVGLRKECILPIHLHLSCGRFRWRILGSFMLKIGLDKMCKSPL